MKALLTLLWIIILAAGAPASAQHQSLEITISNVENDHGSILVVIYESSEGFLSDQYKALRVPASKGKLICRFDGLPPGVYAISVIHDSNNDMRFNKNALGVPMEGLGFSNNVKVRFGPPDFNKVSFEFPESKEMFIDLKYW